MATLTLIGTSGLFLIPSLYALSNGYYILSGTSLVSSLVSMWYWRDNSNALMKRVDRTVARTTFGVYAMYAGMFIQDTIIFVAGWDVAFLMIYLYLMSRKYGNREDQKWFYYHVGFHTLVINLKVAVIYFICPRAVSAFFMKPLLGYGL